MRPLIILFILTLVSAYCNGSVEGHIYTGWESRYFLEGRDELHGDSLWMSSIALDWNHISTGVTYGRSPDQEYDEINFELGIHKSVGDFVFSAGYTLSTYPYETGSDNDVSIGIEWLGLPMEMELAAVVVYSIEQDGYFAEIEICRAVHVTDKLGLEFVGMFGMNQGYVHHGHNGANHVAARVVAEYELTHSWAIISHLTYSWGLGKDSHHNGDEHLIDFFHYGLGVQLSF